MKWFFSFACLLIANAALAQEIKAPDPKRDTLSPSYDLAAFPYKWEEIQAGKMTLAPTHWNRYPGNPITKPGMNSRPVWWDENTIRVFYGISGSKGGIHYFDVDPAQPEKIKNGPVGPIVKPSEPYDDDWVLAPEPVRLSADHIRLYYSAKKKGSFFGKTWSLCVAESTDNGKTFTKYESNPILTCTNDEWESGAVGFCSVEKNDAGWKMWYLGTDTKGDAKKQVGYATSTDGLKWDRYEKNPIIAVDPSFKWEAGAIAVPRVIKDGLLYRVWYCCYEHNNTYAIGQAESIDGKRWFRNPHNPTLQGKGGKPKFDNSMTTYPGAIRHKDRYMMWYTGNGYGAAGIGLAVADAPKGEWLYRVGSTENPDAKWSEWKPVSGTEPERQGYVQFAVISAETK